MQMTMLSDFRVNSYSPTIWGSFLYISAYYYIQKALKIPLNM